MCPAFWIQYTDIEEKKTERKQLRRILLWFIFGEIILVVICILAFCGAHYITDAVIANIFGWIVFFDFLFVISLPVLFIASIVSRVYAIEKIYTLKWDIQTLKTKLRIIEEQQRFQRPSLETYRSQLGRVIYQYQREANRYRRFHYTLQIMIILFSLLVTGLTSGLTGLLGGVLGKPWIAPVLSLSVSFLTAMTALFRFRDRGFNLQQTADAIEYEINAADLGIFDYKWKSDKESLVELAERAERLKDEQRKRQQQLEQASDTKQPSEK